jgi:hypothetical protein
MDNKKHSSLWNVDLLVKTMQYNIDLIGDRHLSID